MIKLLPPTKILCRDGHCPVIKGVNDISRFNSQPFGVNWAPFSYKEVFKVDAHDGIDIAVPVGTPVFDSHDGIVVEVDNTDDNDGLGVELYDEVQKCRTIYWHNSENKVALGQRVKAGDLIALSGGTGKAYGPHLHYGLYLTNENGQVINRTNGYKGAVDPFPFLVMPDDMKLTKEQVEKIYALWGLDESGIAFWVGKELDDLLNARLKDELKQLKKYDS